MCGKKVVLHFKVVMFFLHFLFLRSGLESHLFRIPLGHVINPNLVQICLIDWSFPVRRAYLLNNFFFLKMAFVCHCLQMGKADTEHKMKWVLSELLKPWKVANSWIFILCFGLLDFLNISNLTVQVKCFFKAPSMRSNLKIEQYFTPCIRDKNNCKNNS